MSVQLLRSCCCATCTTCRTTVSATLTLAGIGRVWNCMPGCSGFAKGDWSFGGNATLDGTWVLPYAGPCKYFLSIPFTEIRIRHHGNNAADDCSSPVLCESDTLELTVQRNVTKWFIGASLSKAFCDSLGRDFQLQMFGASVAMAGNYCGTASVVNQLADALNCFDDQISSGIEIGVGGTADLSIPTI